MDLSFAAEEGDWGDDDEGEVHEIQEVEIEAKQVQDAPEVRRGLLPSNEQEKSVLSVEHQDPGARAGRPPSKIHTDPHTRYFIMKSNNHKNIVLSIEHKLWATPRGNQEKLNEAFRSASHVILIFSVTGSGCFQGYAKMLSSVGTSSDVFQGFGRAFEVRWLRLDDLDFNEVNIRNPWNENKSVKVSRDGQELPNEVGSQLCELMDAKVYEGDPSGYIDDSQEQPTGDPALRVQRTVPQTVQQQPGPQPIVWPVHAQAPPMLPHPGHPAHPGHPGQHPGHPVHPHPMWGWPASPAWPPPTPGPPAAAAPAPHVWPADPSHPEREERPERDRKRRRSRAQDSAPPSEWKGNAPPTWVASEAPPQTWLGASPREGKREICSGIVKCT